MLAAMRKKKILNLFLWLVIVAFLATIVVVWGLGDNQANTSYVAKIDDTQISYLEYNRAYENTVAQWRQAAGEELANALLASGDIGIVVLNELINNKLLMDEAARLELPVSDLEVVNVIANDPTFAGPNGSFDQEAYITVLGYASMTPPDYEALVRNDVTLKKMRQLITSSVLVSDEEIAKEYTYRNTSITASYFTMDINRFVPSDINADALENYFNTNAENYRKATQVKLKSISFDPADFEYEFTATDAEIRARYDATLTDFITPESIEINQIVVSVLDWNNVEAVAQAEAKINAAAEKLAAGGDFDAVIAEYSEGSNTGFIEVARPSEDPSGLYAFIFALGDNETSAVYKSEFGYHIFKARNPKAAVVTSFDEAKNALAAQMRDEAFASAYRNYTYSKYRELMDAGNITAYVQLHPDEFVVEESALLAENDPTAFFQYDQSTKDAIFAIGMTEITPLLEYEGKTYVYELTEKVNSYIPTLDEVRAQVLADVNIESQRTIALATIDGALAAVNASYTSGMSTQDFATVAANLGLRLTTLPIFSRANPLAQDAAQFGEEIYTSLQGAVATMTDPAGTAINVVHTDAITLPSIEAMDAISKSSIQSELLAAKQAEAFTSYVTDLRSQHKIEINPSFTSKR